MLAILVAALRKSLVTCSVEMEDVSSMDIGWPTDVRHVSHVTFDRFDDYLGLPVELQPDVPRKVPSTRWVSDVPKSSQHQAAHALGNLAAHGDGNNNNAAVGQETGAVKALVRLTCSSHDGVRWCNMNLGLWSPILPVPRFPLLSVYL